MEIRVLGPIEVGTGEPIAIGGPRQRRLMAALAQRVGEVVSLDRLIEIIWAGRLYVGPFDGRVVVRERRDRDLPAS